MKDTIAGIKVAASEQLKSPSIERDAASSITAAASLVAHVVAFSQQELW